MVMWIRWGKKSEEDVTPTVAWKAKLSLGYTSAVYHDGRVYGLGQTGVTCLSAKDGTELWRQRAAGPRARDRSTAHRSRGGGRAHAHHWAIGRAPPA